VHRNKTKQNDNEHRLVVIFFGCRETKQNKTTISISSSSSFLCAQKQNKKNMTMSANWSSFSLGAKKKNKKNNDKH
jgi:hypothetical protein